MAVDHLERRHHAGAVAGMDARLLDVLHDAADDDRAGRIGDRIDVELDGILEELVDQDRMLRRRRARRWSCSDRAPPCRRRSPSRARRARTTAGRRAGNRSWPRPRAPPPAWSPCRSAPAECRDPTAACANRSRSSARSIESGDVPRIRMPAACSDSASFSGVCPPYWTTHGDVAAGLTARAR